MPRGCCYVVRVRGTGKVSPSSPRMPSRWPNTTFIANWPLLYVGDVCLMIGRAGKHVHCSFGACGGVLPLSSNAGVNGDDPRFEGGDVTNIFAAVCCILSSSRLPVACKHVPFVLQMTGSSYSALERAFVLACFPPCGAGHRRSFFSLLRGSFVKKARPPSRVNSSRHFLIVYYGRAKLSRLSKHWCGRGCSAQHFSSIYCPNAQI